MASNGIEPDDEMERVCAILESIAKQYPPGSKESLAIRDAALAYAMVYRRREVKMAYDKLRGAFDGELTEELKADLRRHGIDPDEMEREEPV